MMGAIESEKSIFRGIPFMLYIAVTADYELFSGKNFLNEEEILFEPTYELLRVAKQNGVPVTLMADVCSVWKYREYGLMEYPTKFEEQLVYSIKENHDVQLHIHPHWLNSIYSNNEWIFDKNTFKIHDLGFGSDNETTISADKILFKGKNYLENLLKPIDNTYKCIAFRAGGWCLQPEKDLIKSLKKIGINIDTTVYKNGYLKTETHYFDYRGVPDEPNWWINPQNGLGEKSNADLENNIYEVCIGSYSKKPYIYYYKVINKIRKIRNKNGVRGLPIGYEDKVKIPFINRLMNKIHNFIHEPIMLSIDNMNSLILEKIINHYIKTFDCYNNDFYISLICHPKGLYNYNFMEMDKFLKTINNKCNNVVEFTTLLQINKLITHKVE